MEKNHVRCKDCKKKKHDKKKIKKYSVSIMPPLEYSWIGQIRCSLVLLKKKNPCLAKYKTMKNFNWQLNRIRGEYLLLNGTVSRFGEHWLGLFSQVKANGLDFNHPTLLPGENVTSAFLKFGN